MVAANAVALVSSDEAIGQDRSGRAARPVITSYSSVARSGEVLLLAFDPIEEGREGAANDVRKGKV